MRWRIGADLPEVGFHHSGLIAPIKCGYDLRGPYGGRVLPCRSFSQVVKNPSQIDHDRKSSVRVTLHRIFMDGNHRVAASRFMRDFEKQLPPASGPVPLVPRIAGHGQGVEQVLLRDDVKAGTGDCVQDGRIVHNTARVVLPALPGSGVVAGDRREQPFRVQCRIRSRVAAWSGATGLSCSAIWPTVKVGIPKKGEETVSDFASNRW